MNKTAQTFTVINADHSQLSQVSDSISRLFSYANSADNFNDLAYGMQLAVHEACTNIVEHAYQDQGGHILLTLTLHPEMFVAEIRESGISFNPEEIPQPNLDEGQVRGYGLFLIKELTDEFTYAIEDGTNYWRLAKTFPQYGGGRSA